MKFYHIILLKWQVKTEDHETLNWVFHQTDIPSTIRSQILGRHLHVPSKGDFQVEWHMGGDLKTLKCMYNISIRGEVRSQKGIVRKYISGLMQSPWWAPKGA